MGRRTQWQSSGVKPQKTFREKSVTEIIKDAVPVKGKVAYNPTDPWWTYSYIEWFPTVNYINVGVYCVYVTFICFVAHFTGFCGQPEDDVDKWSSMCSEDFIFSNDDVLKYMTTGMFILMAFRANVSYSKYWEARIAWGLMWKLCRDITHLMCRSICVDTKEDVSDLKRIVGFVTAFAITTKHLLRDQDGWDVELKAILPKADIAKIKKADHKPFFCLEIISYYLEKQRRKGNITEHQLAVIDTECIVALSLALGMMERIHKSFIPLIYALHQRFIVILFLILISLRLLGNFGWYTILVGTALAHVVLGIDSVACEIEEPFGFDNNDLDLDRFCMGILSNTRNILSRRLSDDTVDYLKPRIFVSDSNNPQATNDELANSVNPSMNTSQAKQQTEHQVTLQNAIAHTTAQIATYRKGLYSLKKQKRKAAAKLVESPQSCRGRAKKLKAIEKKTKSQRAFLKTYETTLKTQFQNLRNVNASSNGDGVAYSESSFCSDTDSEGADSSDGENGED